MGLSAIVGTFLSAYAGRGTYHGRRCLESSKHSHPRGSTNTICGGFLCNGSLRKALIIHIFSLTGEVPQARGALQISFHLWVACGRY